MFSAFPMTSFVKIGYCTHIMAKILLVDDESSVLQTVRMLLASEHHEVVPVTDGTEALKIIQSESAFDILITDLRMTPVDGMQLLKAAQNARPEMPIIVISAYCSSDTVSTAMALGCATYIKKPFRIEEVLRAVEDALGNTSKA